MEKSKMYMVIDNNDPLVLKTILDSKNNYIGDGRYLHYSETYRCYVLDKKKPKGKKEWKGKDLIAFLEHRTQFEFIKKTVIPTEYINNFPYNCTVRGSTTKII